MINNTLTLRMCKGNAISTNYIKPFLQNHRKNFKWYNWNTYTQNVYSIIWFCCRMPDHCLRHTATFIHLPTYTVNKAQNPKTQHAQVKCCSYQWWRSLQSFSLWGTSLFVNSHLPKWRLIYDQATNPWCLLCNASQGLARTFKLTLIKISLAVINSYSAHINAHINHPVNTIWGIH